MMRFPRLHGSLSAFLFCAILITQAGCGKQAEPPIASETETRSSGGEVPENQVPAGEYTFEDVLARAAQEEKFFDSLCRLLLTRSVLFAVDIPAAEDKSPAGTEKLSIKILKNTASEGTGVAMIFSSKSALAASGEKFGWPKNQKGMYSYAAMNGQAAFRVLRANGYQSAVLDAGSPRALTLSLAQMTALAAGQIPVFDAKV